MEKKLKEIFLDHSKPGTLWHAEKDGAVRCFACGHRCYIPKGFDGICKVRSNIEGVLHVPWGYVGGLQVDPIEKKPFFHALPSSNALSFGMLGCDFHCSYCQNWFTSQSLRDPNATARPEPTSPKEILSLAKLSESKTIVSTYNEPLITSEWAIEIFKHAKSLNYKTAYVSNGNATREVLQSIRPVTDFYKIDLKSFNDKHYRELGGVLSNVLDSIGNVHEMGFWLEIVTLVIPEFNDAPKEIQAMAQFLAGVSPTIPWHITGFHQDYKMQSPEATPVSTLLRCGEIAKDAGMQYVYLGNRAGQVGDWENTYCPDCKEELISRYGFKILKNQLEDGKCPKCRKVIPGVWY